LPDIASIPVRPVDATYDESADSSEGGDALARAVVELNLDDVLLGLSCLSLQFPCATSNSTYVGEADRQVAKRLRELSLLVVRICSLILYCVRLTRGPVNC
jgi:hypothetical protein